MLTKKYILIQLCTLAVLSSGCTLTAKQIAGYAPASPQLSWQQPSQHALIAQPSVMPKRRSPSPFVKYLTPLIGQTCSNAKWQELTIKALRSNANGQDVKSLRSGTENIHFDDIDVGDIAFFHSVKNVPRHAVITGRRADGSFTAVTVTKNTIRQVRIHPQRPYQRRMRGRVINSFLRTKSPEDKRNGYLAGELLRELRRPVFLL